MPDSLDTSMLISCRYRLGRPVGGRTPDEDEGGQHDTEADRAETGEPGHDRGIEGEE